MREWSMGDAIMAGFRLVAREPVAFLAWKRRWHGLLTFVLVVPCGALLNEGVLVPFANDAQVIAGKTTAFAHEIIRSRMEQQDMGPLRLQSFDNLTHFVRCGRAQITCSREPHAIEIIP